MRGIQHQSYRFRCWSDILNVPLVSHFSLTGLESSDFRLYSIKDVVERDSFAKEILER
jgi:hypothetical protein